MLEIEVDIPPELAGDLATRVMALWPGQEVLANGSMLRFWVPMEQDLDEQLKRLEETFQALEKARGLNELNINATNIQGPDVNHERLCLGRFVIHQPDIEPRPDNGQVALCINAGPSFGTGGHPSTALMLTAMEEFFNPPPGLPSRKGCTVLDAGTGSGILSLAAVSLGAGSVLAVDTDPEAVKAAQNNLEFNNAADSIEVVQKAADQVEGKFDLILANLVPSVLTRTGKKLVKRLAHGGVMIVAGFADIQTPQVVRAMTKAEMITQKSYSKAGWGGLTLKRME
jgi:ribosomal protein L11 methyltransferase